MLYDTYQAWSDMLAPSRAAAAGTMWLHENFPVLDELPLGRSLYALASVHAKTKVIHQCPPFAIDEVLVGNQMVPVREEVTLSLPFCNLLRFAKTVAVPQPKMLVVAPLSGHFATLLRATVETLSRDHDVYITDWANARDIPLSEGSFGLDDYTDYLIRFLEELGPGANVLAVCQPCVSALVATAIMAEDHHPCEPRTLTLMGGPVDTRIDPSAVNRMAVSQPIEWFEKNLVSRVPFRYEGRGRKVYPGFLQLTAFMAMNPHRHNEQHRALYQHLSDGEAEAAAIIREFYDEYFAVLDLTAEFYLETVDRVFHKASLARGEMYHRGRLVRPSAITRTALLTVEGERDDICSVGQTAAAHDLCNSLRPHLKRHHLQPGVGHYGLFAGRKWDTQVYPQVKSLVLAMG